jgi:archaellum component FlaC
LPLRFDYRSKKVGKVCHESAYAIESPPNEVQELQQEVANLKQYIEEVFTDYNDINEDTRMQLELINRTLAELQVEKENKPRKPIGFKSYD